MRDRRFRPLRPAAICVVALAALVAPRPADAQVWKKVKEKVKDAAETEAMSQMERVVREQVQCLFNDPQCIREAEEGGQEVVLVGPDGEPIVDEEGAPVTDPEEAARIAGGHAGPPMEGGAAHADDPEPGGAVGANPGLPRPGEGVWANYDFVPGEEVLFYEDYAQDKVGDFPRRLEFLNGAMDVVETAGKPWLRATSGSAFAVTIGRTLPDRFTLEFPVAWRHGNQWMRVLFAEHDRPVAPRRLSGYPRPHLQIDERNTGIFDFQKDEPYATTPIRGKVTGGEAMVRLMADGRHVKVFVGEQRVANIPQVDLGRASKVWFVIADARDENPMFVGPIRIAGGGADLYDKLEAEGRVATRGILFATDSDAILPESTPTLEEIGTMLEEHPKLRLRIEGHTDSDGDEAYNLELSERRAAAVQRHLEENHGIDPGRLESAGFGESQPAADNATPEGKQQNRRVELVRLEAGSG